jgi:hypothetical protein
VGLLKRSPAPSITIEVFDDTHTFQGDDGRYWCGGFTPAQPDGDGGHYFARLGEHLRTDRRVVYCKVAGVAFRVDEAQDDRFAPGSRLRLIPEPDNARDPHAIGVWDHTGALHVGYLPRELSAEVATRIGAGEQLRGFVVGEVRHNTKTGPRASLHIVVMPDVDLKAVVIPRPD